MTEEDRLEVQIRDVAKAFKYPATPNLAARGISGAQRPTRRLVWTAAVLLVVMTVAFAVPPVRAALVEVLGIGAVQIRLGEPTPTAPQLEIDLPGETTLESARASSSVYLPSPSDFGPPDRVFVLAQVGNAVVLVWETESVALYVIPAGPLVQKLAPENVQEATVNENPAIWARGDHFLELVENDPDQTVFITGNVLIWSEGGVTYRLESALSLDGAIKLAESLQ